MAGYRAGGTMSNLAPLLDRLLSGHQTIGDIELMIDVVNSLGIVMLKNDTIPDVVKKIIDAVPVEIKARLRNLVMILGSFVINVRIIIDCMIADVPSDKISCEMLHNVITREWKLYIGRLLEGTIPRNIAVDEMYLTGGTNTQNMFRAVSQAIAIFETPRSALDLYGSLCSRRKGATAGFCRDLLDTILETVKPLMIALQYDPERLDGYLE